MSRFLKFVVGTTLEGKAATIKQYVIAIEVFDKAEGYDPQADSTVRTEASKLRSRLSRYYETDGREDPVLISIPKGTYVPVFEERGVKPAVTSGLAANSSPEGASSISPLLANGQAAVPASSASFPRLKLSAVLIGLGIAVAVGMLWF